ncbi:MAG: DUF1848 family protein [Spirochaetes bacterium]|jgi:hypothetical protein|nr:DUF1848 family protein [Spirochaetota bacterium]
MEETLFNDTPLKTVISASRMTDMPAYYPDHIISEVGRRISCGESIHTLVLWTKHPRSLLQNPLYEFLKELASMRIQLFIQLTITGMGGKTVGRGKNGRPIVPEPNAPDWEDSISVLPRVINLVESPERIRLRVDPLIRIRDIDGVIYTNSSMLPVIVERTAIFGINNYCFSLLEKGMYGKVDRRFVKTGCEIIPPYGDERSELWKSIKIIAEKYAVGISACCVEGLPDSSCIDGHLLQRLHYDRDPVDIRRPRKRKKCGCTKSVDISGWPPGLCRTGCDYCYSNPAYKDWF